MIGYIVAEIKKFLVSFLSLKCSNNLFIVKARLPPSSPTFTRVIYKLSKYSGYILRASEKESPDFILFMILKTISCCCASSIDSAIIYNDLTKSTWEFKRLARYSVKFKIQTLLDFFLKSLIFFFSLMYITTSPSEEINLITSSLEAPFLLP